MFSHAESNDFCCVSPGLEGKLDLRLDAESIRIAKLIKEECPMLGIQGRRLMIHLFTVARMI